LIGELFKNPNNGKARRELVVFVTAHLVPDTGGVPRQTSSPTESKAQVQNVGSNADTEETRAADASSSRAWYIMRQWNCPPLLLGLTQQLAKVMEPSQRNGPAWQEVTDGGTLRLKLEVEGDLPGEMIVGLFQDARWSAPPVVVRRLGAGTHVLTGLPAGQYQIGAILGNAPLPLALGVLALARPSRSGPRQPRWTCWSVRPFRNGRPVGTTRIAKITSGFGTGSTRTTCCRGS
jgi:hypothetical protein